MNDRPTIKFAIAAAPSNKHILLIEVNKGWYLLDGIKYKNKQLEIIEEFNVDIGTLKLRIDNYEEDNKCLNY